jgi:hypothetical protein
MPASYLETDCYVFSALSNSSLAIVFLFNLLFHKRFTFYSVVKLHSNGGGGDSSSSSSSSSTAGSSL